MYQSGTKVCGTFRAAPELLGDEALVRRFVMDLVPKLGMKMLGLHAYNIPIAMRTRDMTPGEDDGGITVVAVISTSHIAIHTWPTEGGARIDVDSCREFDPMLVETAIKLAFGVTSCDVDLGEVAWLPRRFA